MLRGMVAAWQDVTGGSDPLLREVSPAGRIRAPSVRTVVLANGEHAPEREDVDGALVVVPASSPWLLSDQVKVLAAAAGVVVVGEGERARQAAVVLPVPVFVPAGTASVDPAQVWRVLLERITGPAGQEASRVAARVAELMDLAGQGSVDGVLQWCARQVGGRVRLLMPQGQFEEFGQGAAVLREVVRGRTRGPLSVGGGIVLAAGERTPRPLLVVQGHRWLGADDAVLLEQAAVIVGLLAWSAGVHEREAQLSAAGMALRVTALQDLMAGNLLRAGRSLERLVPGLVTAGAGAVAVVECAHGEARSALAVEIDRACQWQALTVLPPGSDRAMVVLLPANPGRGQDLEEMLRPLVTAVPGRAAGISPVTPWQQTAAAVRAANGALAHARAAREQIAVHDRRTPLVEHLGADARAWAELVLRPLRSLERPEREELLAVAAQALWWGESAAFRLTGIDRQRIRRRVDALYELTGLDRAVMWQRVSLYLAVRMAGYPQPPVVDPSATLGQVLDHPGARAWAQEEVLAPVPARTREVLRTWVDCGMSAGETARALGIGRTAVYKHLGHAGAATHLDLARPGPAAEAALALLIAGEVDIPVGSLPDLSARQLASGPRKPGGAPTVEDIAETRIEDIDTSRPSACRVLNFYQGGDIHFPPDREFAGRMMEIDPNLPTTARENWAMIHRVIREVVGARGVRQILDLGAGITTSPAVHETAQALAPECRVAYVDLDKTARAYSLPLLESTAQGRAEYWLGDFTAKDGAVLDLPGLSGPDGVLDLSQPVLVLFASALHFIPTSANGRAREIVRQVTSRLATGSYVMITHITPDWAPETMAALERAYRRDVTDGGARSRQEVTDLVEGMRILEPGVVCAAAWRREPEDLPAPPESTVNLYGLVAEVI